MRYIYPWDRLNNPLNLRSWIAFLNLLLNYCFKVRQKDSNDLSQLVDTLIIFSRGCRLIHDNCYILFCSFNLIEKCTDWAVDDSPEFQRHLVEIYLITPACVCFSSVQDIGIGQRRIYAFCYGEIRYCHHGEVLACKC